MKKITLTILIFILIVMTLTGCIQKSQDTDVNINQEKVKEKEEISVDDIYFEVLKGTRNFIDEDGDENNINDDYEYWLNVYEEEYVISYSILDMDEDSKDEMVIRFNISDRSYFILNYDEEDDAVYGFFEVGRGLLSLKKDGTHIGSGGAYTNSILKDSYDKNVRTSETLAFEDYADDSTLKNIKLYYEINGKTATEEEWNEFLDEFLAKEDAEFIEYKTITFEE